MRQLRNRNEILGESTRKCPFNAAKITPEKVRDSIWVVSIVSFVDYAQKMPPTSQEEIENVLSCLKINNKDYPERLSWFINNSQYDESQKQFYEVKNHKAIEILKVGFESYDEADLVMIPEEFTIATNDE